MEKANLIKTWVADRSAAQHQWSGNPYYERCNFTRSYGFHTKFQYPKTSRPASYYLPLLSYYNRVLSDIEMQKQTNDRTILTIQDNTRVSYPPLIQENEMYRYLDLI